MRVVFEPKNDIGNYLRLNQAIVDNWHHFAAVYTEHDGKMWHHDRAFMARSATLDTAHLTWENPIVVELEDEDFAAYFMLKYS